MIIVIGHIMAKAEAHEAVISLSRDHCNRSRPEAGCIAHNVSQDCDNPNRFTFVEYWQDMAALQAHFDLDASKQFVAELSRHLAERPDMRIFGAEEIKPSR